MCYWWRCYSGADLLLTLALPHFNAQHINLQFAGPVYDILGVRVDPLDEISCLVKGLGFLMVHVPAEAYTFVQSHGGGAIGSTAAGQELVDRPMDGVTYPYLLVNVGSGERCPLLSSSAPKRFVHLPAGVSFIVVRSEFEWERVSGSSLGGGTFYGLCHMLTGMTSFDEMLNEAEYGDNGASRFFASIQP